MKQVHANTTIHASNQSNKNKVVLKHGNLLLAYSLWVSTHTYKCLRNGMGLGRKLGVSLKNFGWVSTQHLQVPNEGSWKHWWSQRGPKHPPPSPKNPLPLPPLPPQRIFFLTYIKAKSGDNKSDI